MKGVFFPGLIEIGEDATLSCDYQTETYEENTVNVTWYKDGVQFYHATNIGYPGKSDKTFTLTEVPGIQVNVSISPQLRYILVFTYYKVQTSFLKNGI